jgi:class 3 adenylate cyclase
VGGAGRLNFSVIGDAVNVAARVEAATRELDRDVLITAATAGALGDDVELTEMGQHELKGVAEPVELFAVESPTKESTEEDDVSLLDPEPILAAAGRMRRGLRRRSRR